MTSRGLGFLALLAVIGVSIVFGMILGGSLSAPDLALAAPQSTPIRLATAATTSAPIHDLADIVEVALPAVVSVRSTQLPPEGESGEGKPDPREEFFRWFFPDAPEDGADPRREAPRSPRMGEGSGFIISPDGYILTNYHVVEDATSVKVRLSGGKEQIAQIVGTDHAIDLALLKIDSAGADLPTLPLGNSDTLRVGEWVIAIGNPHELGQTVTVGVISGKDRRVPVGTTDGGVVFFLQTDAAINFGNSGGPLIDARGSVIGINTAIRRMNFAEGIGFALPINHAVSVIGQLRDQGYVKRGYIGISMNQQGIDDNARDYYGLPDNEGVVVENVTAEGPAEKAGVRAGDIIRRVDGEKIRDNPDLVAKIAAHKPGDVVRLEMLRDGATVRVEATLVDRGAALEEITGRPGRGSKTEPEPDTPSRSEGLGLTVEPINAAARKAMGLDPDFRGLLVVDVGYDTDAFERGMRPDMILTAVNDKKIGSIADWDRAIRDLDSKRPVKLTVTLAGPTETDRRTLFFYVRPAVPAKE